MEDELSIFKNFTLLCNNCGSKNIEEEDSRGYSEISGRWGELEIVCIDCNNRETVTE